MAWRPEMIIKTYPVYLLCFFITACYEEFEIDPEFEDLYGSGKYLMFDRATCFFDSLSNTFLYPVKSDSIIDYTPLINFNYDFAPVYIDSILIENQKTVNLGKIKINKPYTIRFYKGKELYETHNLVFTLLPVIHILTNQKIADEPKTLCTIIMNNPYYRSDPYNMRQFSTYAGVEIRGGVAQVYPKKSYNLEFWSDLEGNYTNNMTLLGLRNDDDWILDGMYIDKARMRNRVAWDVWESFNPPKDIPDVARHNLSIGGKYLELFLNNNYQGIYCLNERIDAKQCINYGLNFYEKEGLIYRAENWSQAVFFTACKDTGTGLRWDGWLQEFPGDHAYWNPLYQFVKLIAYATDEDFAESIGSMIDLDATIDYYILLNVMNGCDNISKNTHLVKPNKHALFIIVPWDMDGTFGRNWDSSLTAYNEIQTNNMYRRLINLDSDNYCDRLSSRWNELRINQLSENRLIERFISYKTLISKSGAGLRENTRWQENQFYPDDEIEYISTWIRHRLMFLDTYFNGLN